MQFRIQDTWRFKFIGGVSSGSITDNSGNVHYGYWQSSEYAHPSPEESSVKKDEVNTVFVSGSKAYLPDPPFNGNDGPADIVNEFTLRTMRFVKVDFTSNFDYVGSPSPGIIFFEGQEIKGIWHTCKVIKSHFEGVRKGHMQTIFVDSNEQYSYCPKAIFGRNKMY